MDWVAVCWASLRSTQPANIRNVRKRLDKVDRILLKLFLTLIVICIACVACSRQDDDEKIHALIAKGATMAEAHDITGIISLSSKDVRAMPMNLDKRGIKTLLRRTFNYYGPLKILYPRPGIEVKNDFNEASAQVPFLIVKKDQKIPDLEELRDDPKAWIQTVGETVDLYRLRLLLTKQDGDWLVDRAFLERFTGMGFEE
jgi:hypothetical protein